jgi:uncharacterized protein (TIGR00725 family)
MTRSRQISVIGSASSKEGSELWALAEEVGRLLAAEGVVVVCGGLGGVMDAVSRGAAGAGGTVIGITPSDSLLQANDHCTHVVATGIGHARNLAVVASGEAVIAIGGEWGTLAEIGFARRLDRQVVALRTWRAAGEGAMEDAPGIVTAESAEQAVRLALDGPV